MRSNLLAHLSGLLLLSPAIALGQHKGTHSLGGSGASSGLSNLFQQPQQSKQQQQPLFQTQQPKQQQQPLFQSQPKHNSQPIMQAQQPKQQQQPLFQSQPKHNSQSMTQAQQPKQHQQSTMQSSQQPLGQVKTQPHVPTQSPHSSVSTPQNQSVLGGSKSQPSQVHTSKSQNSTSGNKSVLAGPNSQQSQQHQPAPSPHSSISTPQNKSVLGGSNSQQSQAHTQKSQNSNSGNQSVLNGPNTQQSPLQTQNSQNSNAGNKSVIAGQNSHQSTKSQSSQAASGPLTQSQAKEKALQANILKSQQKQQAGPQGPPAGGNSQPLSGVKSDTTKSNPLAGLGKQDTSKSTTGSSKSDPAKTNPLAGIGKPDNTKSTTGPGKSDPTKAGPLAGIVKPDTTKSTTGPGKTDPAKSGPLAGIGKPDNTKSTSGPGKSDPAKTGPLAGIGKPDTTKSSTGLGKTDPAKTGPLAGIGKPNTTKSSTGPGNSDPAKTGPLAGLGRPGKADGKATSKAQDKVASSQASKAATDIALKKAKATAATSDRTKEKTTARTKSDKPAPGKHDKPSDKVGELAIKKQPADKQGKLNEQLKKNEKSLADSLKPKGTGGKTDVKKTSPKPLAGFALDNGAPGLGANNAAPGLGAANMTPSQVELFSKLASSGTTPVIRQAAADVLAGNVSQFDVGVLQTMFETPNTTLSSFELQNLGVAIIAAQNAQIAQNSLVNTLDPNLVDPSLGVNGGGLFPQTPGGQLGMGILQIIDVATGGRLGIPPSMSGGATLMMPESVVDGGYDPYSTSGYVVSILDEQPPVYENSVISPVSYSTIAYKPIGGISGSGEFVASTDGSAFVEPVTAEEQQMFNAMYANASLDESQLAVLDQFWQQSSSTQRKANYDAFMAQIARTENLEGGITQASAETLVEEPAEPVTEQEQKMFDEMYASLDLDGNTMQVLRDGWTNTTSVGRLADYNAFKGKLAAAVPPAVDGQLSATDEGSEPIARGQLVPVTAVEQRTRYLRIANISDAPAKLHLQYYTADTNGNWNWYPKAPGDGEEGEVIELNPKEAADVEVEGWRLNASKVRIWGANSKGREWTKFKSKDLVLVPERNATGEAGYLDDNVQTYCFTVK